MSRIAWFSPLPPVRSGISAYSAEVLPRLSRRFAIDVFDEAHAHDFVWKHGNRPYDLVVYQLGNSLCHDYQWAYLVRYPGLIVLHDAQLHQSRALGLLQRQRRADYREELAFSHPDAPPDLSDLIIVGLGGSLYYLWPMLRIVMTAARLIAVHNEHVARDLRTRFPAVTVEAIRMGVAAVPADPDARGRIRARHQISSDAMVFACYGKVTAEKRLGPVLRALARVARLCPSVRLLIVGDTSEDYDVLADARALGIEHLVVLAGFAADAELPAYVQAADACVCLRWPSAGETSASWLRCLAAGRPTIVTNLVQTMDVPQLDARNWKSMDEAVCVSVDVLDEERLLELAMTRLATDAALRRRLGMQARLWWEQAHTLELMSADYEQLIRRALETPLPATGGIPAHLRDDASDLVQRLTGPFGVTIDFLRA